MSKIGNQLAFDPSLVIRRPLVTEKSTFASSPIDAKPAVYTFVVDSKAGKTSVSKAIKALYAVTPRQVNIINVPGKKVFNRGRVGRSAGFKKAMVYLKSGDKIELV